MRPPESDADTVAALEAFRCSWNEFETRRTLVQGHGALACRRREEMRENQSRFFADRVFLHQGELDAHTVAMEDLTCAFDVMTQAFNDLTPRGASYGSACTLYETYSGLYSACVNDYCESVDCAKITALEGMCEAVKNQFKADLSIMGAARASNRADAEAKAIALRLDCDQDYARNEALEKGVAGAEARSKAFGAKAKLAIAEVREVMRSHGID